MVHRSMSEPTFRLDAENDRYVVEIDGEVAGYTEYHLRGHKHYFFYHTELLDDYAGQGLGSKLARFALDDVRSKDGLIVPLCPFIANWMDKHTDYDDLVDVMIMKRIHKTGEYPGDLVERILG